MEKRQFTSSSMPFYAIELEPEGFVIMNSDDRLAPVLAYSDTGSLNLEDLPQNAFRALLKNSMEYNYRTVMRISSFTVFQDSLQPLKEVENAVMWTELSVASADGEPVVSGMGGVTNGPFLTTTWDQTRHFNKLCPDDPDASYGYDDHVPAGCVAVVGAQIMNYYEWPYRGSGSHSYTDSDGSITGSHSVVFSDPYDWDNMQDYYRYWTTEPEDAVAAVSELIYEVGVAVDMDYESDGSGAYTSDLNAMMPRAFGYDKGTYIYVPEAPEDVADQIRADMLAGRPAIVTIPGHAVVADGHVDDGFSEYFHINYGWGIHTNNSWFLVDNIAGDSATGCISGLYPSLVALNKTEAGQTNYSPDVSLEWAIADVRTADVQSVSVLQHVVQSNTFTDAAEDFSNFPSTSSDSVYDWVIDSAGYSGDCFYKSVSYYFGESYQIAY
ncbi:C10 family peptidase [Tichowtungia aerotolerans]|uniref:Spi protease inhibitor domain-containing protein n=1 Tax=Tichowtungia aerotolerans TaxID=2697043 RepID=A0A6P1M7F9_9BACT|nr:C10 family peptidase [Tichowtungia aerotolerans]QHI69972.1 hypothetical protein GT409_11085 [Tichowtungia aerotolerans]